jgi:hypothetical protein
MANSSEPLTSPQDIAAAGERIYAERHKQVLEREHPGQFAAVDVLTGEVYIGEYPEDALSTARQKAPNGVFHLLRIGSAGAYRVSHLLYDEQNGFTY